MMHSRNKLSLPVSFFRLTLALIQGGALLLLAFADGQQRSKTPETPKPQVPPQQGGASTGGVFAPVLDEKRRPITAGGFVDGAPIVFEDDTKKSGLAKFQHVSGTAEKNLILEAPGSGVAIFDYDNDGWPDIYLVNGSTFDALRGKEKPPRAALFHNNHDGTFTDVTEKAGVANERFRQESPLSQQPRWNIHGRRGESGRGSQRHATRVVNGCDVR